MNKANFNKTHNFDFTIIIPVYNEEDNIYTLEKRLKKFLSNAILTSCILFVNDGSTDNSMNLLKKIAKRNDAFFYIDKEKNSGLSAALKAGIDNIFSKYTGYMDADLQTAPEDFNLLLKHIDKFELVTGIRANRKDSFFKNIQSKIANGFRRMMTKDGITDTGCPLKVMHTDSAKRMPLFNGMHRFIPALIQLQNKKVKQIPVRHFPRTAGISKYNLWNRLISPFVDCFAFRWMKKRYINYTIKDSNL